MLFLFNCIAERRYNNPVIWNSCAKLWISLNFTWLQIIHIDFLSIQIILIIEETFQVTDNGIIAWRPKFITLTQSELLFYDAVPQLKTEWAEPRISRPLVATRVVQTTSRTAPVMKGLGWLDFIISFPAWPSSKNHEKWRLILFQINFWKKRRFGYICL